MNKLEQRLEVLEAGVVRSYSVEWDLVPYPPKFKALTLQAFDGKGSLNQHIYYFKSQTGNVVANMLARRPITLVLMMINSCSYSTNDLVFKLVTDL